MNAAEVRNREALIDSIGIIDVDTHVMEPADLWTSRIGERWGDAVPHVVRRDDGYASWFIGGEPAMSAASLWEHPYYDEQTLKGGFDPIHRLKWMDSHGIRAQVLYPNLIGFHAKRFLALEPRLRLDCVRAYNDFQAEFASRAPERLIPLANLPWWDIEESIKELYRCEKIGHHGMNFGWRFEQLGLPRLRDPHWAPLLAAVEDMGWSMNFHVGFNGDPSDDPVLQFGKSSDVRDRARMSAELFASNISCIAELIMSGLCDRYPTLKFVSVESGVGFIPYLIEALDWQFQTNRVDREYPDMLLPSEYFERQIYGCFWFESTVQSAADRYPANFMFETDYNHTTSLTPAEAFPAVRPPKATVCETLSGLDDGLVTRLLRDNAAAVYGLSV